MLSLPVDTVALSKCRMLMADLDDDTSIINLSQSLRNTFTCAHNNHSPSNPFCLHAHKHWREQQPRIFLLHPTCEENNKRGVLTERSRELRTTLSLSILGSRSRAPKTELKSSRNSVSMSSATIPGPTKSTCIL